MLDVRAQFPQSSLADLYNPLTMPPFLVRAHATLDKSVDAAYRPQPFGDEVKRIEFQSQLYNHYAGGLFAVRKVTQKKTKK